MITEEYYKIITVEDLLIKQNYKNLMEINQLEKIIINSSSQILIKDKKYITPSLTALEFITSQKTIIKKAKTSIAFFKLKKKQIIGCKVTLRKLNMILFFEKLITLILPRIYNFYGLNKIKFDIQGNYSLGLENLLLFPELEHFFEFFQYLKGMDISIKTSLKDKKKGEIFLSSFQLPLFYNK